MSEDEEAEIAIDEGLLSIMLDEDAEATEYSIEANIDEGVMRIQFHNEDGLLSTLTTDSAGAYDLAHRILRGYDRLEGL